jgi:predicted lipoprotein with Yx(FWY)xxD motif
MFLMFRLGENRAWPTNEWENMMRIRSILTLVLLASATASVTASAAFAAPAVTTVKSEKGDVLAGDKGMTLYTFKNDKPGESNCYDGCAKAWPPFMATADDKADGAYTIVTRKDGSMQWAKDGMPLYYWVKDTKSGDVTGDGFKGVWDAARP